MGMAGWVRLGRGTIRALPSATECEVDLDAQGLPIAVAFDSEGDAEADDQTFELYQDLADAIRLDGGLDELD
jgi:hypothetical protein